MVSEDIAQLFTIEGIVAALIMIGTAYVIVTSTTLYTPSDIHISDMQLEQIASDILITMDTSPTINYSAALYPAKQTTLQDIVIRKYLNDPTINESIHEKMGTYLVQTSYDPVSINYQVQVSNKTSTSVVNFSEIPTGRARMVRATRFVNIPDSSGGYEPVLVELYLWRA